MRSVIVAVLVLGVAGCGGDTPLEHGVVKLQVLPSQALDSSVFAGTQRVRITMRYGECLKDFYAAHPDYAQTGTKGEAIFGGEEQGGEGWMDRLCELDIGGLADCTVVSFEQHLDDPARLTVELATNADLSNRIVPFGPLPTEHTAGCEPCVAFDELTGLDGDGNVIWSETSFVPDEVCTDQGAQMQVHTAPP